MRRDWNRRVALAKYVHVRLLLAVALDDDGRVRPPGNQLPQLRQLRPHIARFFVGMNAEEMPRHHRRHPNRPIAARRRVPSDVVTTGSPERLELLLRLRPVELITEGSLHPAPQPDGEVALRGAERKRFVHHALYVGRIWLAEGDRL